MSNLIITIISIGLIAIAAVMGIWYGGQAYQNARINAVANSIINEAQQILTAERIWSTNNGQPDISGMGAAGASGTGMSMLVSSKALAEWPSFGGILGYSTSLTNPGPQPYIGSTWTAGTITTGSSDNGCYNINGYFGSFARILFSYNSGNYVAYYIDSNTAATLPCNGATNNGAAGGFMANATDTSSANNPIVKVAVAINNAMNQIPSSAITTTMPYIGLPAPPNGTRANALSAYYGPSTFSNQLVVYNGVMQSNYCYLSYNPGGPIYNWIACVFGPS